MIEGKVTNGGGGDKYIRQRNRLHLNNIHAGAEIIKYDRLILDLLCSSRFSYSSPSTNFKSLVRSNNFEKYSELIMNWSLHAQNISIKTFFAQIWKIQSFLQKAKNSHCADRASLYPTYLASADNSSFFLIGKSSSRYMPPGATSLLTKEYIHKLHHFYLNVIKLSTGNQQFKFQRSKFLGWHFQIQQPSSSTKYQQNVTRNTSKNLNSCLPSLNVNAKWNQFSGILVNAVL